MSPVMPETSATSTKIKGSSGMRGWKKAKQRLQVVFEAGEQRFSLPEIDQFRAPVDEKLHPFGERVELAQQRDARRLQCRAQRPLGGGTLIRSGNADQRRATAVDFAAVDIEFAGEDPKEPLTSVRVERQKSAPEIGCSGARRD